MQLTDDWIIGFFEGEGSFHSARGRRRSRVYPRFAVTQKEYNLLVRIKDYFGFGGISYTDQPTRRIWKWTVFDRHDLKLIIAFLEGRIRSKKKAQEFERWKSLFRLYLSSTREYVRNAS